MNQHRSTDDRTVTLPLHQKTVRGHQVIKEVGYRQYAFPGRDEATVRRSFTDAGFSARTARDAGGWIVFITFDSPKQKRVIATLARQMARVRHGQAIPSDPAGLTRRRLPDQKNPQRIGSFFGSL